MLQWVTSLTLTLVYPQIDNIIVVQGAISICFSAPLTLRVIELFKGNEVEIPATLSSNFLVHANSCTKLLENYNGWSTFSRHPQPLGEVSQYALLN